MQLNKPRQVNDDPLFAFYWLAGLRGLRRGELCGLRWSDIDLDRAVLTIERNRTTAGYQVVENDPKTPAGRRAVALDKRSVQILRVHRRYEQDRCDVDCGLSAAAEVPVDEAVEGVGDAKDISSDFAEFDGG